MNCLKVMMLSVCIAVSGYAAVAQEKDETVPSYRAQGYRGNISFTDQSLIWMGFDTSHGYMFNQHHYLGAGVGLFLAPIADLPVFGHLFVDYHAYILKKKSTPMAGVKAGYCFSICDNPGNVFDKAFEIEPNIGWNWALSPKKGLNLSLGASIFVYDRKSVVAMPKIAFAFEF